MAGKLQSDPAASSRSGAMPAAYVLGWLALAAFLAAGVCMMGSVRSRLRAPYAWHRALFVLGVVFVIAHAIVGRL